MDATQGRVLHRRRLLTALLVLATLLPALAAPARPVAAAPAVRVGARANFDGNYQPGQWVPVTVELTNDGAPVTGDVVAEVSSVGSGDPTRYFQRVELPTRARKVLTLYALVTGTGGSIDVSFRSGRDAVPAPPVPLRPLKQGQRLVGVIGDDAPASGEVARNLLSAYGSSAIEAVAFPPDDMPGSPFGLGSFSALVLTNASTGRWTAEQREALAAWVARGGQLVVAGGSTWRKTAEGLGELPPVRFGDSRTVGGLGGLGQLANMDGGPGGNFVVATGEPIPGAARLAEGDGGPLVAGRGWGRGTVYALAFDPAAGDFTGWGGAGALWKRLGLEAQPPPSLHEPFTSGGGGPYGPYGPYGNGSFSVNNILRDLPSLGLPPTWLLLLVLLAFIAIVGPVNYLVLRRLDRRDLAWATIPALTLLFAGGIYGFGAGTRGRATIVNTVSVVRIAPGGRAAELQSFYGVFTPSRGTRQLPLERDALLTGFSQSGLGRSELGGDARFGQGDGATVRDAAFQQWTLRSVAAQAVVDPAPLALKVELRREGNKVVGRITNESRRGVEDVTLLLDGAYQQLGALAPGASVAVDWTPTGSGGYRVPPLGHAIYSGAGQGGPYGGPRGGPYGGGPGPGPRSGRQLGTNGRRAELLNALSGNVLSYGSATAGSGYGYPPPYAPPYQPTPTPTPAPAPGPGVTPGIRPTGKPLQVLFWRSDAPLDLKLPTADREATTLIIQETFPGAQTQQAPESDRNLGANPDAARTGGAE